MTNDQIILNNRIFLMEEGVLKGTGEIFLYEDESGKREIEIPEEIHTFQVWKDLGYMVKKGEHSIARFPIWHKAGKNMRDKKDDEDVDEEDLKRRKFYMKTAFFFKADQVEKMQWIYS